MMMRKIVFLLIGLMLFSVSLFVQVDDILFGLGDVICVKVYGSDDFSLEICISEVGVISFLLVGEVKIGGLFIVQVEIKIVGLFKKGGYLVNLQVNILVIVFQSQMVLVLGQVFKLGCYLLDGKCNVVDVIVLVGGVMFDGGDVVIIVCKNGGVVSKQLVDIYSIMYSGDILELLEV